MIFTGHVNLCGGKLLILLNIMGCADRDEQLMNFPIRNDELLDRGLSTWQVHTGGPLLIINGVLLYKSGQIIATSHDLISPKCWFSKGNLWLQGNVWLVNYYNLAGNKWVIGIKAVLIGGYNSTYNWAAGPTLYVWVYFYIKMSGCQWMS